MAQKTLQEDLNYVQKAPLDITMMNGDLNIIQKLDDEPNDVGGLSATQLKEEFDKAGNTIKTYLNETLIPELLAADATERSRAEAEQARLMAENNRRISEDARIGQEDERLMHEGDRGRAEKRRDSAEKSRAAAEQFRAQAEQVRVQGETARLEAINQAADRAEHAAANAGKVIDDSVVSQSSTWSSQKIRTSAVQILDLHTELNLAGTYEMVNGDTDPRIQNQISQEAFQLFQQLCQENTILKCKLQLSDTQGAPKGVYPVRQWLPYRVSNNAHGEKETGYRIESIVYSDKLTLPRWCMLLVTQGSTTGKYYATIMTGNMGTDTTLQKSGFPADAEATGKAIEEAKKIVERASGINRYELVDEFDTVFEEPLNISMSSINYEYYDFTAMLLKITLPAAAHGDLGWINASLCNPNDSSQPFELDFPLIHIGPSDQAVVTHAWAETKMENGWWKSVSNGQPLPAAVEQQPVYTNGFRDSCLVSTLTYECITGLRSEIAIPSDTHIQVYAVKSPQPEPSASL